MGGAMVGVIFFIIGMLAGITCTIRGVYLAVKSSCTELNAIIWCWAGAGICIVATDLWPIVAIFAGVIIGA